MKSFHRNLLCAAAIAIIIAVPGCLYGQSTTGSLVGTVRDSSGAVLPGAKVVATDVLTGIPTQTVTNSKGDYTFPNLAVGVYTINFSVPSFQPLDVQKVEIHVFGTIRQDAILSPAGVVSKVVVSTSSAPLLQSETSDISQLVEAHQISELPLNGRDVYSLLTLTAGSETGVAPSTATEFTSALRLTLAGGRAGFTVFRVNGIDVNNQNLPSASIQPSIDAVEEFRAVTQLGTASESGTSSVNLVTKSGTNEFHGTAYDFLRNNVLDAEPYFQVALPPAPGFKNIGNQLRYNQFGGSIGGPIWKDRTFFFASVQATRQRTLSQFRELFPTSAELSGDFSGIDPLTGANFTPVYDPQTGLPFPGNQVPSDRFSSFAAKFLPIAFQPANCLTCLTSGLGFDFVGNGPGITNDIQYMGRVDHHIGVNDSLLTYFLIEPSTFPNTISPLPASRLNYTSQVYEGSVGETHTFSPTLLNVARLGYVRDTVAIGQTENANGAFTFHNTPFSLPSLFPTVAIVGYPYFGNSGGSSADSEIEDSFDLNDTLTWIRGNHEVQAGFEAVHAQFLNPLFLNAIFIYTDGLPPVFGFTTNGFADFLLGVPYAGETLQGTTKAPGVKRTIWSAYVQDNWKILPRLTLNLGLRYDLPEAWRDIDAPRFNRLGTLDTSAFSQSIGGRFLLGNSPDYYVPGSGVITGTGKTLISGTIVNTPATDIQPRVGFAFRPPGDNKTAIRGGFGIYYGIQDAESLAFEMLSPPYQYTALVVNLPPTVPLGQPLHDIDFFPVVGVGGAGTEGNDPRNRDPREYQWTLNAEHQLSNNILLSLEYLGNRGVKLPLAYLVNQAQLPDASELSLLLATPSLDTPLAQARSPYPNVPITYLYESNSTTSSYNALNVEAEGRYGKRLNFSAVYTWSKALDIASSEEDTPADTYNLELSRSYSAYDHPQRFVGSWVYNLPSGDTVLVPSNPLLKGFVRGWETSGIATFEAGPPYSVIMGADTSFRGGSTTYPNLIGPLVYSNIRKTHGIYLTPQNFLAPPFGQLGTVRRNQFHGPGINNFDLGLIKNTPLHDNLSLQLRVEMFNAFNHGQFQMGTQSLATAILPPAAGSSEPTIQYLPSSQFGRVVPLPTRVVQIAAKVIF